MITVAKQFGSTFYKSICAIIIWIILSFTAVPFFLIAFTIRFLSSKVVPLACADISSIIPLRSFSTDKDEFRASIVFSFGLEGSIKLEELRESFESRIIQKKTETGSLQWPELQQYIVHKLGFPFWKWDTSFNIQKHIHMLQPSSELYPTELSPQDILDVIEGQVIHRPFAERQSPWEILVVSNYKDTPIYGRETELGRVGTMILFRYDHSLGDGVAVANVFRELFNGEKKLSEVVNSDRVGCCSSAWKTLKLFFFGPLEMITHGSSDSKFYWEPNSKITKNNLAVSPTIPIEIFKNIRAAYGANFSAVAILLLGRALHRFMKEAGYEVPEAVLFNLARVADKHPLTKFRNHTTSLHVKVQMHMDSMEMLGTIQASLETSIESRVPQMNFLAVALLSGLWSILIDGIGLATDGKITFSNMNFYDDEQSFKNRNKLRSVFICGALPVGGGNGIIVTSVGCKDGIRFLFQIDEGIVPKNQLHAQEFIKYFMLELELLTSSISQNSD